MTDVELTDVLMRERVDALRERVRRAWADFAAADDQALAASVAEPEIVAVSKFQPVEAILEAQALGFRVFGENRVQELRAKQQDPRLASCVFDLIGSLQTNKVKFVVGNVRLIHSVDRAELISALNARAVQLALVQDVLLQVNYSEEATKHGATEEEALVLLDLLARCPGLRLRGLMTMAAPFLSFSEQEAFFKAFRVLFERWRSCLPPGIRRESFDTLSMGMSDDFEAALRCGSNCVRIGRAIFGSRPASQWH